MIFRVPGNMDGQLALQFQIVHQVGRRESIVERSITYPSTAIAMSMQHLSKVSHSGSRVNLVDEAGVRFERIRRWNQGVLKRFESLLTA